MGHLAAEAILVVVPDVERQVLVIADGVQSVHGAGPPGADKIGGDDVGEIDVVQLLPQVGADLFGAKVCVKAAGA